MALNFCLHLSMFLLLMNTRFGIGLKYFSNFKFEKVVFGQESLIKDYMTLANDPIGNLPDSYTVCSSVFVKFFTNDNVVVGMLQQDGSPWYLLIISSARIYDTQSEAMIIWYVNPITEKAEYEIFSKISIPIVPHSWYHICMGLDTVSGLLRIVVNGVVMVNEEKEYFRNTVTMKPGSLEGKVLMFKEHHIGLHLNNRGMFTNMNIFGSMKSVDAMIERTSGGSSCFYPGDYLRCVKTQQ